MGYGFVRAGLAASVAMGCTPAAAQVPQAAVDASSPGFAAVAAAEEAEPVLPTGASPGFVPPARDPAGYLTPNRNLSPEEKTWHVRVALNVAALGCRGAEATEMVGSYNALLTADREALAAAASAMGARYKARFGSAWQARHDDAMTRLYNFWALPPVRTTFCAAALGVLREAAAVEPAGFPIFASAVLPRLEAPMLAFFEAFDRYRIAHEAWRTRRARAMIAAAVPPAPVAVATAAVAVAPAAVETADAGAAPVILTQAMLQPIGIPLPPAAPAIAAASAPMQRVGAGEP